MSKLHPLSTESRYSMDMACQLLYQYHPRSVRVYSDDVETVQALARRLGWLPGTLTVGSVALVEAVSDIPGIHAISYDAQTEADAAVVLFPEGQTASQLQAKYIVAVGYNAFSYKSLLRPGSVGSSVFRLVNDLKTRYTIDCRIGLFTPTYLVPWLISMLAGTRFPVTHFRAGQIALDHLFVRNWIWRTGYIVIVAGHQRS